VSEPPWYSLAEFKARWDEVKAASAEFDGPSVADRLALCEREEPGTIGSLLDDLGPEKTKILAFDRDFWLRPKQLIPFKRDLSWLLMLLCAGRGFGKTRPAAEWVIDRLETGAKVIVVVGPSYDEIRQYQIGGHKRRIDGGNGSGLLDVMPPWIRFHYKEDEGVIEFPDHKAVLYLHSAEVPEFRGPEPDTIWGDEVIKWRFAEKLLSNLRLACRAVGKLEPRILLTTSPKRIRLLRDLVMEDGVITVHGTSDENLGNTHVGVYEANRKRLTATDGKLTRQGLEELGGELGIDDEGDLFPLGLIDEHRVQEADVPPLDRILVAVDPSGSGSRKADRTGLVAVGRAGNINTGHCYVLQDKSEKFSWEGWGLEAVKLAEQVGASSIVVEKAKWAEAPGANIRTAAATRGWEAQVRPGFKHLIDLVKNGRRIQLHEVPANGDKATRAGPVSTLYEAGRVHHVGHLTELETELSEFSADATHGQDDGMDALVHAITELFELHRAPTVDYGQAMKGLAKANAKLDAAAGSAGGNRRPEREPMGRDVGGGGRWGRIGRII
jgi:phage terminase large subunit-like protein